MLPSKGVGAMWVIGNSAALYPDQHLFFPDENLLDCTVVQVDCRAQAHDPTVGKFTITDWGGHPLRHSIEWLLTLPSI